MTTSDLVERLRRSVDSTAHEGADALEAKDAELERLRPILGEKRCGPSAAASAMSELQKGQVIDLALNCMDENHTLRERLETGADLIALLDEGFLVRNIDGDSDPSWAIKALPKLRRLASAVEALRAIEEKP